MAVSTGVEIGPSTLRAVTVERNGAAVRLRAAREVPCETSNGAALTQALVQLRQALPITRPVILGLPTGSTILTTLQPLVANPRRASLAVQFELQQLLPFELADSVWHSHWLVPAAEVGRRKLEVRSAPTSSLQPPVVVVDAIRRSILDERLACCRRAGVSVLAVGVNGVAAVNAWHAPVLATIDHGWLLHLVNAHTAEWVLWTPTTLQVVPVLSTSAQTLVTDLIGSWESLHEQAGRPAESTVWMAGSAGQDIGLAQALSERFGVRVESFDPSRVATMGAVRVDQPQALAAPLGLALQGLGTARLPLNLLASAHEELRVRRMQQTVLAASGVLAVAAVVFAARGMLELSRRYGLLLASLEQREEVYQSLRPEIRTMLQHQERLAQRNGELERVMRQAPALTRLLAHITEALPDTVWLTTCESSKSAQIAALLEGRARTFADVTQLMDRLKTIEGVTAVKPLSTSVATDATSGRELIVFGVQVQMGPLGESP